MRVQELGDCSMRLAMSMNFACNGARDYAVVDLKYFRSQNFPKKKNVFSLLRESIKVFIVSQAPNFAGYVIIGKI